MTATEQVHNLLTQIHDAYGIVPTLIRIPRSNYMRLCWENDVPIDPPEGAHNAFLGVIVEPKPDAA